MRILKGITVAVLWFLVLLNGCSQRPSIKFSAKWSTLTEMWINSGNVLNYSQLESKEHLKFGGMGTTSSGKYFVLLIKSTLPLGQINIKAIHISNENRQSVFIFPNIIQNNDPRANLRAKKIYELKPADSAFRTYTVEAGRYYIFLEKDGVELAGSELLIR